MKMNLSKTKVLRVCIIGLFIGVSIIPISTGSNNGEVSFSNWPLECDIIVGPDEIYKRIQDAIDVADPGNCICVKNGTYQQNIVIDKSICLLGENRSNTIINGTGVNPVVKIGVPDVKITGFTIQNGDRYPGVLIETIMNEVKAEISDCIVRNNEIGIRFIYGDGLEIMNCIIEGKRSVGLGIDLYHVKQVNISNCEISNFYEGIYCYRQPDYYTGNAREVTIYNCSVFSNENGISFYRFTDCDIINSSVYRNSGNLGIGIMLYESTNIRIKKCNIFENTAGHIGDLGDGILITSGSKNNMISQCEMYNNSGFGVRIDRWLGMKTNNNYIWQNIFGPSNGEGHAYDNEWFNNYWDNGEIGNYWFNYQGDDLFHGSQQNIPNPDGIIDFPYVIDGKSMFPRKDRFPIKYDPRIPDPLAPNVSIIYPNGGENLFGNVTICWNASDLKPDWPGYIGNHVKTAKKNLSIDISISNDGGAHWKYLATELQNTGFFEWNTTNNEFKDGMEYLILINATDNHSNKGTDVSSNTFVLNNNGGPIVSNIFIRNIEIDSSEYLRNNDNININANIIGDEVNKDTIWADLTEFGLNSKCYPDEYNGVTASWFISNVNLEKEYGQIRVNITAYNSKGYGENYGIITLDNIKPYVKIYEPESGIYVNNRRIIGLPNIIDSIAIGKITIRMVATDQSGISEVRWYLDEEMKESYIVKSNSENRFEWTVPSLMFFKHKVRVMVYDNARNYACDDITFWKLI
ncbi:MAG: right-handed parallel beta-helix repeat-containing protein [Candidatus Thermoplasmatota archaeon]|nr:right-handed parallel beta-helix repeat-containing protein [Candidatus Thermoplasmatota archaeon]